MWLNEKSEICFICRWDVMQQFLELGKISQSPPVYEKVAKLWSLRSRSHPGLGTFGFILSQHAQECQDLKIRNQTKPWKIAGQYVKTDHLFRRRL